ncbi:hypothetical protein IAR50_004065 [Cryptococcus sp. DSM 104548]
MTTTLNNHTDSIIPTPGGVVRVRPFRSSSNAQLKAILSFTPRVSALDRHNTSSQTDQFRGFFVLFWIGMALLFLRTTIESWEENRTPLSWTFGRLITGDALVLAISDGIMVLSMFLCVPFVKALQYGWLEYNWTGSVIQHVFQSLYLAIAVWWGYHRQWYWVQSGFLVLHAMSCMMKMHSYMAHNGMLATVSRRLQKERKRLDKVIAEYPGGREALLREAGSRKAELEAEDAEHAGSGSTPLGTPAIEDVTSAQLTSPSTGYEDPSALPQKEQAVVSERESVGVSSAKESASRSEARQRLHIDPKRKSNAKDALPSPRPDLPLGTSLEPSFTTSPHTLSPPGALAWSSNEEVALLATNIDAMQEELKSNGALGLVWPQNVTYKHFWEFMLFPTLVYQLEYPRTET